MDDWLDVLNQSATGIIFNEEAYIDGRGDTFTVAPDTNSLFEDIPSPEGVQRLLEEFDVPTHGWT
jgi:hypothetical protein